MRTYGSDGAIVTFKIKMLVILLIYLLLFNILYPLLKYPEIKTVSIATGASIFHYEFFN